MARNPAVLLAALILALPGCSSPPPTSGTGAMKLKDPVWATFGWSRNRMSYVIFFVPSSASAFNPEGAAANAKIGKDKEGDVFEGGLDGYAEKSKSPYKVEVRKGEITIEGKMYRTGNGSVFLVNVGTPSKVQQLQIPLPNSPKDPEEWPVFAEGEVKRILNEHPKIKDFPKEPPPPEKPTKKK